MRSTHNRCGKSWTGYKPEHCTACCETFSGTTAGDKHRRGPFTARICVAPAEVGLVYDDSRSLWTLPPTNHAPWS